MNKLRFEAFSDGVFAFAITLLILGLILPKYYQPPTESLLTHDLLQLWPNFLAYLLSFAVIGIMWQNHHACYRLVERIDRTTVFWNLLGLCVVVFIPFATSALGTYPTMKASTFLYGVTMTTAAGVYTLLYAHLVRSGAFRADVSARSTHQTMIAYRIGVVIYAIAMLIALIWPIVSFSLYILVTLFFLIPRGIDRDIDLQDSGP